MYYLIVSPGVSGSDLQPLMVIPGDLVVVEEGANPSCRDWWLGHVIHAGCGARNPHSNSLFQVADIDTGFIRIINADLVKGILRARNSK